MNNRRYARGLNISEGVQIFRNIWTRNIWTGGPFILGVQIFRDSCGAISLDNGTSAVIGKVQSVFISMHYVIFVIQHKMVCLKLFLPACSQSCLYYLSLYNRKFSYSSLHGVDASFLFFMEKRCSCLSAFLFGG